MSHALIIVARIIVRQEEYIGPTVNGFGVGDFLTKSIIGLRCVFCAGMGNWKRDLRTNGKSKGQVMAQDTNTIPLKVLLRAAKNLRKQKNPNKDAWIVIERESEGTDLVKTIKRGIKNGTKSRGGEKVKRALIILGVLIAFAGAVYAADVYTSSGFDSKVHGFKTWIPDGYAASSANGAGKQLGVIAADTVTFDIHAYQLFSTATVLRTCQAKDSARVHTYFAVSMDFSQWYTVDSVERSGKSDDTLFAVKTWTVPPAKYGRIINQNYGAAACTSFIGQQHFFQQD